MFKQNKDNQKNEVRNQGNRRYSMLLMALLFIGMATYGTYAYFTDSTSVDGSIKLKLGTVALGDETKEWTYVGYGNDSEGNKLENKQIEQIKTNDPEFNFVNVQPGDQFTKEVTVEYTGTLDAVITVDNTYEGKSGKLSLQAIVKDKDGEKVDKNKTVSVSPRDKFTVVLTATVPIRAEEESFVGAEEERLDSDRNVDDGIDLTTLTKAVTITATQNLPKVN